MGDQQQIEFLQNVFRLGKKDEEKKQQKISTEQFLQGITKNKQQQESACIAVSNALRDSNEEPYNKLIALRFLTQCMKTAGKQIHFHESIKKYIKEDLFNYACLLAGDDVTADNFGQNLFLDYLGNDPQLNSIKKTFACFLAYDVLHVWQSTFKSSAQYNFDYEELYQTLQAMGLNFQIAINIKNAQKQKQQQKLTGSQMVGGPNQSQALQQSSQQKITQSVMPGNQQQMQAFQQQQKQQQQPKQTPGPSQSQQTPGVGQSQLGTQKVKLLYEKLNQIKEMIDMVSEGGDQGLADEFLPICKEDNLEVYEQLLEIEEEDEELIRKQNFTMDVQELLEAYQGKPIDAAFRQNWKTACDLLEGKQQQQPDKEVFFQKNQEQEQLKQQQQLEEQKERERQQKMKEEQEAEEQRRIQQQIEEEKEKQRQIQLQKEKEERERQEQERLHQQQLQQQLQEQQERERQLQLQKEQEEREKLQREQQEREHQEQLQREKLHQEQQERERQEREHQERLRQQQQEEEQERQRQLELQKQKEIEEEEKTKSKQKQIKKTELSLFKRIGGAKGIQSAYNQLYPEEQEQEEQKQNPNIQQQQPVQQAQQPLQQKQEEEKVDFEDSDDNAIPNDDHIQQTDQLNSLGIGPVSYQSHHPPHQQLQISQRPNINEVSQDVPDEEDEQNMQASSQNPNQIRPQSKHSSLAETMIQNNMVPESHKYTFQQYVKSNQDLDAQEKQDLIHRSNQSSVHHQTYTQSQSQSQYQQQQPYFQSQQPLGSKQKIFQSRIVSDPNAVTINGQQIPNMYQSAQRGMNKSMLNGNKLADSQYSVKPSNGFASKNKGFQKNSYGTSTFSSKIAQDNKSMMHPKGEPSQLLNRHGSPNNIKDILNVEQEKIDPRAQSQLRQSQQYMSLKKSAHNPNMSYVSSGNVMVNQSQVMRQQTPLKSQQKLAGENDQLQRKHEEHEQKIQRLQDELKNLDRDKYLLKQENQQLKEQTELYSSKAVDIEQVRKNEMQYTDNYLKLQQDYELKKEELEKMQETHVHLQKKQDEHQTVVQQMNQQLNKEKTLKKKKEDEIHKKLEQQQDEIRKLKAELDKKPKEKIDIQQKQKEINDLITKHNKVQKQTNLELEKKSDELSKLKKESTNYQNLLQSAHNQNQESVQKHYHETLISQKEQEIEQLKQKHDQEILHHKNQIVEVETKFEEHKQQQALGSKNQEQQIQQHSANANETQQQLQQMKEKCEKQEKQIVQLQEDCDRQGNELWEKDKEIRDNLEEIDTHQNKVTHLQFELEQLNQDLKKERELLEITAKGNKDQESNALIALNEEKEKVQKQYNDATYKLEQLEHDNKKLLSEKEDHIEKMKLDNEFLKQENSKIQQNLDHIKKEIEEERESNQKILNQTYEENKNLNDQNQILQSQINQVLEEQEKSRNELQKTIHKQDEQLKELQNQLESRIVQYDDLLKTQQLQATQQPAHVEQEEVVFKSPQQQQVQQASSSQPQQQFGTPLNKSKPQIFEEFKPSAKRSSRADLNAPSMNSSPDRLRVNGQQQQQHESMSSEKHILDQLQHPLQGDYNQPQVKLSDLIQMQQNGNFPQNQQDILAPNIAQDQYFEEDDDFINHNPPQQQKTLNQIKNVDPMAADLIYPYNNPLQYYENKHTHNPKGRVVTFYHDYFKDQLPIDPKGLHRFKRGCMNKGEFLTLFQNDSLQILAMVNYGVEQDYYLSINLIFKNISQGIIQNFKSSYVGNGDSFQLFSNPSTLMSQIQPMNQLTQDLQINFSEVPYHMILMDIEYQVNGQIKEFSVSLPHTINQYLEVQQTTPQDFKKAWKDSGAFIIRSQEFNLESSLLYTAYDFLKIFPEFFEVNEAKAKDYNLGISETRIGGQMFLKHTGTGILIKIIVQPNNKVVFQMTYVNQENHELHDKTLEFVLNTFILLYTKQQNNPTMTSPQSQYHSQNQLQSQQQFKQQQQYASQHPQQNQQQQYYSQQQQQYASRPY